MRPHPQHPEQEGLGLEGASPLWMLGSTQTRPWKHNYQTPRGMSGPPALTFATIDPSSSETTLASATSCKPPASSHLLPSGRTPSRAAPPGEQGRSQSYFGDAGKTQLHLQTIECLQFWVQAPALIFTLCAPLGFPSICSQHL